MPGQGRERAPGLVPIALPRRGSWGTDQHPFLSQRKPRAGMWHCHRMQVPSWGAGAGPAQSCMEFVLPGELNAGLRVPGMVSPWRDEHHQQQIIMGTCHMLPCCSFFSFSIPCAPFIHPGVSCEPHMGPSGDSGMWLVTAPGRGPGVLSLPQSSTVAQELPAAPASMK